MAAILDFLKVAPRLILKVRSQGIIMPKMARVSIVVTIVTLSHQTISVSALDLFSITLGEHSMIFFQYGQQEQFFMTCIESFG